MAKKTDFTKHSAEELAAFVAEKRETLRALRFSVAGSKNRNVKEAKELRKTIARALTATNARKQA